MGHTALHGGPFKHFVLERGGTTLILRQEKEYCLKYFFKHPSFAQLLNHKKVEGWIFGTDGRKFIIKRYWKLGKKETSNKKWHKLGGGACLQLEEG